jgi:hypothetical protein
MSKKRNLNTPSNKVSLAPLTPEQALFAAMNTKPPARKKSEPKPKPKSR